MSLSISDDLSETASLEGLLRAFGVFKSSVVRVTGPSALPALLWLCRHGYDQVGYVRAGEGSPHEEPDAIIAVHACNELELKRLLTVARQVKPGGVFVFRCRAPGPSTLLAVDWLLVQAGFTLEKHIQRGGRALVVARRRSVAMSKAA